MGGWEETRVISKDSEFCYYWLNNKRLYKLEDYKDNLQKRWQQQAAYIVYGKWNQKEKEDCQKHKQISVDSLHKTESQSCH